MGRTMTMIDAPMRLRRAILPLLGHSNDPFLQSMVFSIDSSRGTRTREWHYVLDPVEAAIRQLGEKRDEPWA
jgi:hypothetical protein